MRVRAAVDINALAYKIKCYFVLRYGLFIEHDLVKENFCVLGIEYKLIGKIKALAPVCILMGRCSDFRKNYMWGLKLSGFAAGGGPFDSC